MAKGHRRPKDYERAGPELGKGNNWYHPEPPVLTKKDIMRKMVQNNKGKR